MGFDRTSQKVEGVAALLAAGFHHRQHRLDEATAAGALGPERRVSAKSPHDAATARPHCSSAPRLHGARTSTATSDVRTIPGTCRAYRRGRTGAAQQQTLDVATHRSHPTQQSGPRNPAVPVVGPVLKQLTRRMPQTETQVLCPRVATVDHRLKIAFQMRPAPLQIAELPVHLGPIAGDDAVELLAQERGQSASPRAWHAPQTR